MVDQKRKREIIADEKKLGFIAGETIKKIKAETSHNGDTKIFIETEKSVLILGANDLGAWFEKIEKRSQDGW